jgi:hypothetical protein
MSQKVKIRSVEIEKGTLPQRALILPHYARLCPKVNLRTAE